MKVRFTKMHGAGNDYIYVNTQEEPSFDPAAAALAWSRPHMGIGSDGLVLISEPTDPAKADFRMRIFNADGSEAMMCGNASRCIGKYVYERGLTRKATVRLETLSGVKVLQLHLDDHDRVESVTVDMLRPTADSETLRLEAGNRVLEGLRVSMGNPHFVVFIDDVERFDVARYGSLLEVNPAFPDRSNIEFAELRAENEIRMRVWERGSGITMACGTGACATAVAAASLGKTGRRSSILMDGGTLNIEWNATDDHVYMTGPAAFVFEGEVEM